jgi:hypothetical protein
MTEARQHKIEVALAEMARLWEEARRDLNRAHN